MPRRDLVAPTSEMDGPAGYGGDQANVSLDPLRGTPAWAGTPTTGVTPSSYVSVDAHSNPLGYEWGVKAHADERAAHDPRTKRKQQDRSLLTVAIAAAGIALIMWWRKRA